MSSSVYDSPTATALLDVDPSVEGHATCPLCHTTNMALSNAAVAAGEGWRCARCCQQWTARRLATVAAYAASSLDRAAAAAARGTAVAA